MKTIATDLDGTLFKGETLINGVREAIVELRSNNIEIYFTTNNSSQSPLEIKDKLIGLLSLEIEENKIITPLIIFKYLLSEKISNLYVYGTDGLKNYIKDGTMSSDKTCLVCGAEDSLIYQEGCVTCSACGHSKCS